VPHVLRAGSHLFPSTPPSPTDTYTLSLHDALPIFSATTRPLLNPDAKEDPAMPAAKTLYQGRTFDSSAPADLLRDAEFQDCTFRSEEHTSELQSRFDLVCRLLLEKKNKTSSYSKYT